MALVGDHDRGGDLGLSRSLGFKVAILALLLPLIPLAVWAVAWAVEAVRDLG